MDNNANAVMDGIRKRRADSEKDGAERGQGGRTGNSMDQDRMRMTSSAYGLSPGLLSGVA